MLNILSSISKSTLQNALKNDISARHFFRWLIIVFNGVDRQRVEKVGADRSCAEWLLRNGASVRWTGDKEYLTDYNILPDSSIKLHIQAVDATNSAIHHIGFPHFSGCKHIEEVKLINCPYIENSAIPLLAFLKDSLENLEIIECKNITKEGLKDLKDLKKLKILKLGGMPYLEDKSHVLSELTTALPNCKITYE